MDIECVVLYKFGTVPTMQILEVTMNIFCPIKWTGTFLRVETEYCSMAQK